MYTGPNDHDGINLRKIVSTFLANDFFGTMLVTYVPYPLDICVVKLSTYLPMNCTLASKHMFRQLLFSCPFAFVVWFRGA